MRKFDLRLQSDIRLLTCALSITTSTHWIVTAQARICKLARSIDADSEPHPYLSSDFNESNPVAHEIMKSGVRLK